MVAPGGTVGAELGCGVFLLPKAGMVVGGMVPVLVQCKASDSSACISSGEEYGICVAGTLTKGNPGCLGCGDLRAEFQSVVPSQSHLCEAEEATL